MSFYQKLRACLQDQIPEKLLEKPPKSYNMVGKVLILKLRPELEKYKKEIGEAILKILPVKTVCLLKRISYETRKPEIEVIAGNGTETLHKEHGCIYKLDVAKVMFSKGNKFEKLRLVRQVKEGEIVVDMFAGIGYFTIPIAKLTHAKKVYAIDINPEAISYLKENVKLNKVEDKVEIFQGDCREVCKKLGKKIKANRIIMGYIFRTHEFLESALSMAKKKTIIHYHFLAKKEEVNKEIKKVKEIAEKQGFLIRVKVLKKIKSYAPFLWHWVADLSVDEAQR